MLISPAFFVKNQISIIGLSAFACLFVFHYRVPDAHGTTEAFAYQKIHISVPK